MASHVDELTIDYEEEGILIVKQLDKVILSKGAWATIIYKYCQWERQKEAYSPDRFTIRRYRKMHGEYRQQSKFNISSRDQAQKIIDALKAWLAMPIEENVAVAEPPAPSGRSEDAPPSPEDA